VLESVVDHSLNTRRFLDTAAETAQDSFDEFVAWCDRTASCALYGRDVRAFWKDLLARADRGELSMSAWQLSFLVQRRYLPGPDWPGLAVLLKNLGGGGEAGAGAVAGAVAAADAAALGANPAEIFCQDWNLPVRSHAEYAAHLRRLSRIAPDLRYPAGLLFVAACLGAPPADNPQDRLRVRNSPVILLTNSLHDPATGYAWATNVKRQLGDRAVLLTYEGAGHGTYTSSACAKAAIDRYLVTLTAPAAGTRCPAAAS
jgi:hypothetical protein